MEIFKWTEQNIVDLLRELDKKTNLEGQSVPVKISKKMSSTKGRFKFLKSIKCDGTIKITPMFFSFAYILLDGRYDKEIVRKIIIHEYTHYYCAINCIDDSNHGKEWKEICIKLGGDGKPFFEYKPDLEKLKRLYKGNKYFECKCSNCGNIVIFDKKTRKLTKILDNPNRFACSKCLGSINIELKTF